MSSSGRGFQAPSQEERVRINHQIRLSPVRLIDPDGGLIGVVPVEEARSRAEEAGLDLVEVNPNVRPIVCRIMDYGRFKYDKQKKERKSRTAASELKQIKYRPGIDGHDFDTKTSRVREFLEQGFKVRVTVMFRKRDMRRPENGLRVLNRVAEVLADVARADDMPTDVIGRDITCTLTPLRQPVKKEHVDEGPKEHRLRRHERAALGQADPGHADGSPSEPDDGGDGDDGDDDDEDDDDDDEDSEDSEDDGDDKPSA